MVRTSLIRLVNSRVRDKHWWFNGRKLDHHVIKSQHVGLRILKENDEKAAKTIHTSQVLEELIGGINSKSYDTSQMFNSIKKLENSFRTEFDKQTSIKMTIEQLRLLQSGLKMEIEMSQILKKAINDWENDLLTNNK